VTFTTHAPVRSGPIGDRGTVPPIGEGDPTAPGPGGPQRAERFEHRGRLAYQLEEELRALDVESTGPPEPSPPPSVPPPPLSVHGGNDPPPPPWWR